MAVKRNNNVWRLRLPVTRISLIGFIALQMVVNTVDALAEIPAEVVVGTEVFRTEESFLKSSSTAHRIIRAAVTSPLLRRKLGTNLFTLIFADSFQVDSEGDVWSYRVRNGMVFSNNEAISGNDICYSLLNCQKPAVEKVVSIESCSVREGGIDGAAHQWIDVRFSELPAKKERQAAVIESLSSCPVLEQKSSQIFGLDLAKGSSILASGEYQISDFLADKAVHLQRFQRDQAGRAIVRQTVVIKGFSSMKEALTALRVGTIGMFFNTDPEIEKVATQDETLRVGDCAGDRIVYRRGFQFTCQDVINLGSVSWDLTHQPQ